MEGSDVNLADVVAEVRAVFDRYETALVANDLDVLDELFWNDRRTQRFAFGTRQNGFEAVQAARRAVARQTSPRTLRDVVITSFGRDLAVVMAEFVPDDRADFVGYQSQTWVRFPEGWRVVAAHVS